MKNLREYIEENYPDEEFMMIDNMDSACVGISEGINVTSVLIYDKDKCLSKLIKQGMSEEEALEFFDFNIAGAYVGEKTPLFINKFPKQQSDKKSKSRHKKPVIDRMRQVIEI